MSDVEKIGSAGIPLNIVDANGRKIMGDAYDNTATYAVGDYCISGDHAYKCTIEIETPEDFNTNHWQQITIEEILKEHDASIESLNSSLTQLGSAGFATMPSGLTGSVGYAKIGRMVIISGSVNYTGSLSANTSIASTLPNGYTNNMPLVAVNNNTGTIVNLLVKDNGELHTKTATESNGSLRFCGAYLSAS